ncbi:glycoside hydrolase [Spirosoma taeanense]|uniref:Glycoside hydrolase n=1 Tax=Spirosoma taeanense TaxID=2735870 RepID=A0A6M5Y7P6_9BACT|nr:glycosyl hydrolase [Spirosoma taeanense]QJW90368.1 glycoside hydrolase [Spirosoma taeanense]
MKKRFLFTLLLISGIAAAQPAIRTTSQQAKPWTYWWWMGSAVNEKDITHQLEQFAQAGLGGVHIIPIYGVKGYESQFIPFLSDRWLAVFAHTVREGERLGMGVDLTTGTGWPFGGPNVTPDIAAKAWQVQKDQLVTRPTRQQVKRAGPGGQGPVVDYFSKAAMEQYLKRFDSTLIHLPMRPRAVYNDSYEVYGANWTDNFLNEFRNRRSYDLASQLTAFLDTSQTEQSILVHQDYHQTLAELLRDGFTQTWADWARKAGYLTRNQAHGSPGNLIDLYARVDIPETESFGSSRYPIPGLRVDKGYEVERFGTPNPLAMKFASSAANLTGKPLVSSESGTWLANHFQVSLSQLKPQFDELFTAGINHIFYHGIPYSPRAESWPGWLFYASTNYGPSSHFWPHLPLLNQYVERCQTRLQNSRPDNDVLVYFPIHDLWATPAKSEGRIHQLEVHHVERWLLPQPYGQLGEQLLQRGYSFDGISDELLNGLSITKQGIRSAGGATYQVILVPRTTYIPETTLRQLDKLARQGARVVFEGDLPQQAAGFHEHQTRSAEVQRLGESLKKQPSVTISADPYDALNRLGIRVEPWAAQGLSFIRKRRPARQSADTTQYFIANLGNRYHQNWVTLSAKGHVSRYDPLTGHTEVLPVRQGKNGQPEVFLAVEPGQSCFINVAPSTAHKPAGRPVSSVSQQPQNSRSEPALVLQGPWQFQFGPGRPALIASATLPTLVSWTALSDSAGYFSGIGRYTTMFNLPAGQSAAQAFVLDLGDVREVADVRLNGQLLGTAWCLPFRLTIPANRLKRTGNRLEVAVTNLSANYMRLYDRLNPSWKKFNDINIVDIRYRPFDATTWEAMPSGLLGPVTLRPVASMSEGHALGR